MKPILIDIIKQRKSIRTYLSREIPEHQISLIEKALVEQKDNPFDENLHLILVKDALEITPTYGSIKGAKYFIAGKTQNTKESLLAYGYVLENIMLYSLRLGLSSCWLAGSFKRNAFTEKLDIKEKEIIPAISPLGYEKKEKHVGDKIIRAMAKSDKRKDFSQLFFHTDFKTPLKKEQVASYVNAFEAVRWAPSIGNKQPWLIVMDGDRFHFYQNKKDPYKKETTFDIQKLDMGIACCHFEGVMKEEGAKGVWKHLKMDNDADHEYIFSYCL